MEGIQTCSQCQNGQRYYFESISKYEDYVYSKTVELRTEGKKTKAIKKLSAASTTNRLRFIITVFNQIQKKPIGDSNKAHLKRISEYCESFQYEKRRAFSPKPISKEDYLKILVANKDKIYRTALLIALNCGMRETEIADIRIKPREGRNKADINLESKELTKPRTKTGIISVAILWDRTVTAIKELIAEQPENETEFLFLNNIGKPIKPKNIEKWWRRIRKIANVDESVKFEHIRDATQTIPLDDNPASLVETNLIMGHAVKGVANNYLERRPKMVRRACASIEKYFFGDENTSEEKKAEII
ncbi:MAG: tyrosine-type recombinase/integrase [Phycisphaerae bacterium]